MTSERYFSKAHLFFGAVLAAGVVPCFLLLQLPLKFSWGTYFSLYWIGLSYQSLFLGGVLYACGETKAFLSVLKTKGPKAEFPGRLIVAVLIPAAYFFVVFFLVVCYNDIISAAEFDGSGDALLGKLDSLILAGGSISRASHFAVAHLAPGWVAFAEFIYFGMFSQIGACMVLLAARSGLRESFRFASALATSYYLAVLLFAAIPATGPYYQGGGMVVPGRAETMIGRTQNIYSAKLRSFSLHQRPVQIDTDYYIALPCMHLVQPIIVLWFLRKRRRMFWILVGLDTGILASIIILNQHYFVDLLAAVPVALLSIAAVDWHGISALKRDLECGTRPGPCRVEAT